jgi:hypothetical protein
MNIDPRLILAIVGAIMLALAFKDFARERRITPAVKTRLIVAAIFVAVLVWLSLYQPGGA